MNDEVVHFIPIRAAHTSGDTNIKFEKANVLFIGDFYRNYGYPFIDLNNGGSLKGMLEGLDATMKSADANTELIPGHGTIIKRDDIIPYRDMIVAVTDKVQQLIAQGKSLEEVLAAKVTAPYDAKTAGGTDSSAVRSSRRCIRSSRAAAGDSADAQDSRFGHARPCAGHPRLLLFAQ